MVQGLPGGGACWSERDPSPLREKIGQLNESSSVLPSGACLKEAETQHAGQEQELLDAELAALYDQLTPLE